TLSAEAVVVQADFTTLEDAQAFRAAVLVGADIAEASADFGGEVTEHGRVLPNTLPDELDSAVFETEAFEPVIDSENEVSDVIVLVRQAEEPDDTAEAGAAEDEADAVDEAA